MEAIEGCGMGGKVPIKKVALRIYPPENQYGNGKSPFLIGDTSSISVFRVSCSISAGVNSKFCQTWDIFRCPTSVP